METSKRISISTSRKSLFRQYLEIMGPFHNITSRECDLLAQLMYYNDKYGEYPPKLRSKAIFDYDTKNEIKEELGITTIQFNNLLKILRKKGAVKGENISEEFMIYPEDTTNIIFTFNIDSDA